MNVSRRCLPVTRSGAHADRGPSTVVAAGRFPACHQRLVEALESRDSLIEGPSPPRGICEHLGALMDVSVSSRNIELSERRAPSRRSADLPLPRRDGPLRSTFRGENPASPTGRVRGDGGHGHHVRKAPPATRSPPSTWAARAAAHKPGRSSSPATPRRAAAHDGGRRRSQLIVKASVRQNADDAGGGRPADGPARPRLFFFSNARHRAEGRLPAPVG